MSSEQTPKELGILLNPCNHCRIVDACRDAHDDDEYPSCYTRPHPAPAQNPLAKENLTVGMVTAYEAGLADGARQAREDVLDTIFKLYRNRRNLGALDGTINNDELEDIINSLRITQHPGQEG